MEEAKLASGVGVTPEAREAASELAAAGEAEAKLLKDAEDDALAR